MPTLVRLLLLTLPLAALAVLGFPLTALAQTVDLIGAVPGLIPARWMGGVIIALLLLRQVDQIVGIIDDKIVPGRFALHAIAIQLHRLVLWLWSAFKGALPAMFLFAVLLQGACAGVQPQVVLVDAAIATVPTVNALVKVYGSESAALDAGLASKAVAQCASVATHAGRATCQSGAYATMRVPYVRLETAIKLYRGASAAGVDVSNKDLVDAAAEVIATASAVGFHVTGGIQ